MAKASKLLEKVSGGYAPLPFGVMDSEAYKGLSYCARSVLTIMLRQYNGRNNGHYQLTHTWLAKYGFTSRPMNVKAKKELIERGLIQQTRFGGMRMGASLYAVTWLPISNSVGLDINRTGFNYCAYKLCDIPPTPKRPQPKRHNKSVEENKLTSLVGEPSEVR